MTNESLQAMFANAIAEGAVLGNGTSYFNGEGFPVEGDDVILATAEGTIKVAPGQNTPNLVVSYLTKGGRWVSKNTLFGRHYLTSANKAAQVSDMKCRTTFAKPVAHKVQQIRVKAADGTSREVSVYTFDADTPVKFGKIDKVFLPASNNAWNKETRTMQVDRERENYATLTVG